MCSTCAPGCRVLDWWDCYLAEAGRQAMMLFGVDWNRSQPAGHGGLLRGVGIVGAGRLALRWWRNRRSGAPGEARTEGEPDHNPIHGWQ